MKDRRVVEASGFEPETSLAKRQGFQVPPRLTKFRHASIICFRFSGAGRVTGNLPAPTVQVRPPSGFCEDGILTHTIADISPPLYPLSYFAIFLGPICGTFAFNPCLFLQE